MNEKIKFGSAYFDACDIHFVRALATGRVFRLLRADTGHRSTRDSRSAGVLYALGFAIREPIGMHAFDYRASPTLLALAEEANAHAVSFGELAAQHGLDISPQACRKYLTYGGFGRVPRKKGTREFPNQYAVSARANLVEQTPFYPSEEKPGKSVFSSPGLTAWYVKEYLELNRLNVKFIK